MYKSMYSVYDFGCININWQVDDHDSCKQKKFRDKSLFHCQVVFFYKPDR